MKRTTTTLLACLVLLPLPAASAGASAAFAVGPSAPSALDAAAGPGAGAISLSWAPAQSLAGVSEYRVYRVDADGGRTLAATTDGATTSHVDAGLGNGATVTYVVAAVDLAGEGPASEPATATTFTTPDAPRDVAASPGAPGTVGEVVVSWSAPASDGGLPVTAYRVHRDGALVATLGADATTWTDAGLDAARDHAYAVSAVNDAGEGPLSDAACSMASPWGLVPGAPACLGLA